MSATPALIPAATQFAERLADWSRKAQGAFADNTERALRADSAVFSTWCAVTGRSTLPAAPETVVAFLRAQAEAGNAIATLRRRASTIARMHRAAGLPNPCDAEGVRLALRALARSKGTQQKQAVPLVRRDADRIADRVLADGARLKDRRDVALMLIGRDLLTRASELVSLAREDVEFTADGGALVSLRRYKTSTEARLYKVGPDAAAALKAWLAGSGIASGPVFRSITRGGMVTDRALSVRDVGRILKALGGRAKLDPMLAARLSGHSLRVGMAIDLVAASVPSTAILQAAGWTTPRMLARYTERLETDRGAIAQYYRLGSDGPAR